MTKISQLNQRICRAIMAVRTSRMTDVDEVAEVVNSLAACWKNPVTDFYLFGSFCYLAGIAEGKHQDRQRRQTAHAVTRRNDDPK